MAENDFDFEWVRFLGAEPVEIADARSVMRLHPKSVHLNHNGTVNAPVLYGLAEVAGAGAVMAGMLDVAADSYVVVKNATIDYLAPARGIVTATGVADPQLWAKAKEDVAAGAAVELESTVEITDAEGRTATRVVLTMAVRPRKK